jgi:ribose transport system ATP-binding protein
VTQPSPSPERSDAPDLLLEAVGVTKAYGAVQALRDAHLGVRPGEVHALLGANGAGKSTLIKILTGVVRPDGGRILIRGQERRVHSPSEAHRSGLVPVYQEPALLPDLDLLANLRLSRTSPDAFMERMGALGIPRIDPHAIAGDLPLAVQRVVDLARAMTGGADVLLLDEITAALPADLAEHVLGEIGRYRASGRSVIFISHRLLEISALCDRATVLRDGETVGVVDIGPGAEHRIVELMLGPATPSDQTEVHERARPTVTPAPAPDPLDRTVPQAGTHTRLEARNLRFGSKLVDVSFQLRTGEVVGVVALEGQGQDELFGVLSGDLRPSGGSLLLDGDEVSFGHPADAIARGITLVPGDRATGLLSQRSVHENIALPYVAAPRSWGPIDVAAERTMVHSAIERLQIDTRAQGEVRRLSGGNQQKVTIARWIAGGIRTLLCFDPTRGIDIRTKRQVYVLLGELAAAGAAVLLYTSELEEVQLACDRAVVIFGGRVVAELDAVEADEAALMRAAYGLSEDDPSRGQRPSDATRARS